MNPDSLKWLLPLIILLSQTVEAQLSVVPLPRSGHSVNQGRTAELEPISLPFWDDFSFETRGGYVNDTLWDSGKRVWVNSGLGVDPPSVMVATFDGLDSIGKPYSVTDIVAKGFADQLVSRKIRLGQVPEAERSSVFLSFYYQSKGRGEVPDEDDNLSLWFRDKNGTWVKVFETTPAANPVTSKMNYVVLPVSDSLFFHDDFRFRFQHFARLSGPWDMWHVDYVYLNKGRVAGEKSMPDRTVASQLTPFFSGYTSIPLAHYRDTFPGISLKPKLRLYGMLENNFQPFRYTTKATITERTGSGTAKRDIIIEDDVPPLDPVTGGSLIIRPFEFLDLQVQKSFPGEEIDPAADSVHVDITFGLNSADDNPLVYLPKYRPINFLRNDTVKTSFTLANFYARDDGTAEFGAGLNTAGNELAYGFDLLKTEADTLVAVDIYFPQFGDQSNQSLILKVWDAEEGTPVNQLHQQTITVKRTEQDNFTRYPLSQPVTVSGRFYVGWKQNATAVIPVGLDKANFTPGTIFFNETGDWEEIKEAYGSLMIRPVFGAGNGETITSIKKEKKPLPWPNPSEGSFRLPESAEAIRVFDITGKPVDIVSTRTPEGEVSIDLSDRTPGIRILHWQQNGAVHTARLVIGRP